jgi:hypothetical protein
MVRQNEIVEILGRVDEWPPEDRVALAYQILRDMRVKTLIDPPRHTLETALGLGRGSGPAPTDEQVEQLMLDHRSEKYDC